MLARQRRLIIEAAFLAFDGSGQRINAITITVVRLLQRFVVASFDVARGHIGAQQLFAADFIFVVFEASSAVGRGRLLRLESGFWVDAKVFVVKRNNLFDFEVAIAGTIQTIDAARLLEVHSAARTTFGFVLTTVTGTTALGNFLTRVGSGVFEFFAGEMVYAPTLTGGTVMLGRYEKTVFVAGGSVASDHARSLQSRRSFLVAWRTHRLTVSRSDTTSVQFFAGVRIDAPAVAGGTVALLTLIVSRFSALRHEFAGHFLPKTLPFFGAWPRALQSRSSNGQGRQ